MSMKIFGSGSVFPHDPADDIRSVSGSGEMLITMTFNDDYSETYIDKTFDEIVSAIDSGKNVKLVSKDVTEDGTFFTWFNLSSLSPHDVIFSEISHLNPSGGTLYTVHITNEGTITEWTSDLNFESQE